MERHFDKDLEKLKQQILFMGSNVEQAIQKAIDGLTFRKVECFQEVYKIEKVINDSHMKIDDACVKLLARHSLVASNLRLVVAIIKINTDLERMGDQAINISDNSNFYIKGPPLKPLIDIPKMAQEVQVMVHEALEAFVKNDIQLARHVLERDDVVDGLKDKVFQELIGLIESDGNIVRSAINLILITRNLERLGDHATNIAEDVIFFTTGQDIRHRGKVALKN